MITIPSGATLKIEGSVVTVNGPLGSLTWTLPTFLRAEVAGDGLWLRWLGDEEGGEKSLWGFYHRILSNALTGVVSGFTRFLELSGVGYRAKQEGKELILSVGFSHPVKIVPPAGITLSIEGDTRVKVFGMDKQKVGELAAKIRAVKPAEPYKGKGIKYAGEVIRKKAGKAGKVGTAFGGSK